MNAPSSGPLLERRTGLVSERRAQRNHDAAVGSPFDLRIRRASSNHCPAAARRRED